MPRRRPKRLLRRPERRLRRTRGRPPRRLRRKERNRKRRRERLRRRPRRSKRRLRRPRPRRKPLRRPPRRLLRKRRPRRTRPKKPRRKLTIPRRTPTIPSKRRTSTEMTRRRQETTAARLRLRLPLLLPLRQPPSKELLLSLLSPLSPPKVLMLRLVAPQVRTSDDLSQCEELLHFSANVRCKKIIKRIFFITTAPPFSFSINFKTFISGCRRVAKLTSSPGPLALVI